jgi:hypothetical protein
MPSAPRTLWSRTLQSYSCYLALRRARMQTLTRYYIWKMSSMIVKLFIKGASIRNILQSLHSLEYSGVAAGAFLACLRGVSMREMYWSSELNTFTVRKLLVWSTLPNSENSFVKSFLTQLVRSIHLFDTQKMFLWWNNRWCANLFLGFWFHWVIPWMMTKP